MREDYFLSPFSYDRMPLRRGMGFGLGWFIVELPNRKNLRV